MYTRWYTWWLAHLIKGGEVSWSKGKKIVLTGLYLGQWPDSNPTSSQWRAVKAALSLLTGRWVRSDRTRGSSVRSNIKKVVLSAWDWTYVAKLWLNTVQRSVTVSQWLSLPSFHQLLHPYLNVPTTKCITLCTCVSIFSQIFSRMLASH